jgi:hypothetical protein
MNIVNQNYDNSFLNSHWIAWWFSTESNACYEFWLCFQSGDRSNGRNVSIEAPRITQSNALDWFHSRIESE